jgi:hypothetical protein
MAAVNWKGLQVARQGVIKGRNVYQARGAPPGRAQIQPFLAARGAPAQPGLQGEIYFAVPVTEKPAIGDASRQSQENELQKGRYLHSLMPEFH